MASPTEILTTVADIRLGETIGWQRHKLCDGDLWLKGVLFDADPVTLGARLAAAGPRGAASVIGALDGHYGIVFQGVGWTIAGTDAIGSVPISYARHGGQWSIGGEARRIVGTTGGRTLNQDAILAIAMAGYTVGRDTLYQGLDALGPGEAVIFHSDSTVSRETQYIYAPSPEALPDSAERLCAVLQRVFGKMIASLDGRPVLIPLSAGLDSRLVASGLREAGYDNVRCFSYGQTGNHEAKAAQLIARKLGFPWTFVPNTPRQQRCTFTSAECNDFMAFADTLQAVPFQQDFHAVGALKRSGYAPPDAVFVNGQSGDFISGNHIPDVLTTPGVETNTDARWERLNAAIVDKHFGLWGFLRTPDRIIRIAELIRRELDRIGVRMGDPANDYALFEASEYRNRQSKYVVAGQRTYEWHGFDWRLPLWDREFIDFWRTVPLVEKARQTLFADTLRRLDWGGVWGAAYWPRRRITPPWLRLPRLLAMACHAPLGKVAWHRFERRFFAWRMDTVANYAVVPYRTVACDTRGHRNAISWHVERYLAKKGLALDGGPAAERARCG